MVTNIVYNCDCMDKMREYPDKYFELAVCDPPYGIGASKGHDGKCGWKKRENKEWDNEIPKKKYWDELFRISKNQIIWGGNYFIDFLFPSMGWIFWDKGQRNFSLADGELAFTSFKKALRVFDYSRARLNNTRSGFHPTEKPVALYKWLLTKYAKKGDKIIDTHGGSCSIGCACIDMDFDIDIMEIDKDYFNNAVERLSNNNQIYIDFT